MTLTICLSAGEKKSIFCRAHTFESRPFTRVLKATSECDSAAAMKYKDKAAYQV